MNATLHNDFSSAGKALAYGHFPLKSYEQMTNQGLRQGWVYLVTFRVHARGKALESSKTYWLIDCYCAWQTRSFFKVDLWMILLAYQTLDFGMARKAPQQEGWTGRTHQASAQSFSKANRTCQAHLSFPQEVSSTPVDPYRIDEWKANASTGLASGPMIQRFLAHMLRNLSFGDTRAVRQIGQMWNVQSGNGFLRELHQHVFVTFMLLTPLQAYCWHVTRANGPLLPGLSVHILFLPPSTQIDT